MEQIISDLNKIEELIEAKQYDKAIYAAENLVIDNGWPAVETALKDIKAPWYVQDTVENQKYAQEFAAWSKLANILCTFSYDAVDEVEEGKPNTSEGVFNKLSKALDNAYVATLPSLVTWLRSSRVMGTDLQSLIRQDRERHHERDEDNYCLWYFHAEVFALSKIALAFSLKHYEDDVVQVVDKAVGYAYKLACGDIIRRTAGNLAAYDELRGALSKLSEINKNAASFLAYITESQSKTLHKHGYNAASYILSGVYHELLGRDI